MESFKALGKIRDAHGIKGEVFLISFSKTFDWLQDMETAYLSRKEQDEEGNWVEKIYEFRIKRKKPHKVGHILKLEGIENRNQAEAFKGALFQVPSAILDDTNDGFYVMKLKGFKVTFAGQETQGEVTGFASNGAQDILLIDWNDKVVEIPFVEAFTEQIDFENQRLFLKVPEGLLHIEEIE